MSLLNEASFLVTPNSYKEDKLYAAIPTNGNGDMTFTRGTTATRVNEAGLIELVPYNIFLRSQEFDNADWTKTNCTITANDTTAPDGYTSADRVTITALAQILTQSPTLTSGQPFVFSVFVKEGNWGIIRIGNVSSASSGAWFNVTNGTAGTINGGTSEIIDYGNGWYRLIAKFTSFSTGISFIGLSNADGSTTTSEIGTFMYVWGAQLVEGTSALTYQKTVDRLDIPRIDYTGGGCPSILLEPQRTNRLTYSEQFDNAAWTKQGTSSVSGNTTIAPDGSLTADTLSGATGTGVNGNVLRRNVSGTVDATLSIYIKSLGSTSFTIYIRNGSSGAVQSQSITPNGTWQRVTLTSNPNNGQVFFGNTDGDVAIWGAQLEAGSYPTSYIPTTTATVTRNADVLSRDNIYTNNLIVGGGGTWFVHLINNTAFTSDANGNLFLDTASGGITNGINIRSIGTVARLYINFYTSGVSTFQYLTTADTVKLIIKWNGATADVFENGAKVVSATLFATTAMEHLGGNGSDQPKYIKQTALFAKPLTDAQCIALTTL
jgi:hypothetical protein